MALYGILIRQSTACFAAVLFEAKLVNSACIENRVPREFCQFSIQNWLRHAIRRHFTGMTAASCDEHAESHTIVCYESAGHYGIEFVNGIEFIAWGYLTHQHWNDPFDCAGR